ncbi:MAG: thioredoxin family protein [Anaeromyxobacteraceae bacterium]
MSRSSMMAVLGAALVVSTVATGPGEARAGGQAPGPARPAAAPRVPRLVDLGAGKCIPCKAMAPILEELRSEYAGRMEVQFIDVWKDPDAGKAYGVTIIPTQIFYGADGRELARHQGFMAKKDILARWKALGVNL